MNIEKLFYDTQRALFRGITSLVPTCDLQFAISSRLGVQSIFLDPTKTAELVRDSQPDLLVHGPAWITINKD